jgi:hypothetical protein
MPIRTMVEWRCSRCGNEEVTESGKPHSWRGFTGPHRYQGNSVAEKEPFYGGDICPDCVGSLVEWWQAGKGPRRSGA